MEQGVWSRGRPGRTGPPTDGPPGPHHDLSLHLAAQEAMTPPLGVLWTRTPSTTQLTTPDPDPDPDPDPNEDRHSERLLEPTDRTSVITERGGAPSRAPPAGPLVLEREHSPGPG